MLASTVPGRTLAAPGDDERAVAALDREYQAAVKAGDAATMDRILADDFVLVTGRGKTFGKAELLEDARTKATTYEQQDEVAGTQKVRVWGDTAVVTALLWCKGVRRDGTRFDYQLWFSDTYVRTPTGWRYAFGQASLPLPEGEANKILRQILHSMIKIKDIAYTGYPVTDIVRARKFYEGVLGLTSVTQFEHEGKHWIEYDVGPATLAISNMAAGQWKPSADGPSIALEVEDFDSAVNGLRDAKVKFALEPMDTGVCRMAYILDPDGNSLAIHKRKAS